MHIVIAFAAGGTFDTLRRILTQKLTEASGQNVVIESRPAPAAIIGAAVAAKAARDGYTLHFGAQMAGRTRARTMGALEPLPGFRVSP
jgi:tripartite-type tricarboxylate transporter receptor subunit TctC